MTKPWVRSIARTALFATVLLAASAASGQVQLEGSAVVRNDKAGAYVIAPKGWILDQQSGASEGFLCVMYPKGSSWRSAGEVMSISIGQILPGKTLADFIETWAAERRKTSPRLEVFDLEPIRLATGQKALVRRFALDQLGTVECVAYAPLDSSVAVYALSSRTAEGYAAGIGLFQEMVAASGIMAMPAAGGSSPGDARSGRPARTPGGYSQWARYKPGAFVTFKYTMTSAQTSGEMLKTIRLKEVTPGFVRLTYQESPAGGARSDYYDHQERDFGEAEQEFTKESPVEALLNYHISDIVGDVRGRTVDSGIEEVELKGIKIATARTKYEVESEGLRTTVSVWWAEDVPGRLWRLVREYAGAVSSREEVVVTDFSAPAASSVELEKLRAGREPVAIEVPALDYLRARCRLPDRLMDMGADFLFRSGDSPSGAATPSPGDLLQSLDLAKVEFEADRQRIMTELGPQESSKLVPILDIYKDVLALELKAAGNVAEAEKKVGAGADGALVLESLRGFAQDYRDQMRAMAGRLAPLMRALYDVTVKFTKMPD